MEWSFDDDDGKKKGKRNRMQRFVISRTSCVLTPPRVMRKCVCVYIYFQFATEPGACSSLFWPVEDESVNQQVRGIHSEYQ